MTARATDILEGMLLRGFTTVRDAGKHTHYLQQVVSVYIVTIYTLFSSKQQFTSPYQSLTFKVSKLLTRADKGLDWVVKALLEMPSTRVAKCFHYCQVCK